MSEDEELSEDELNALLSDLESRSDGGGGGGGASADPEGGGPEDEDLESFLQQADQEESSGGTETAVKDRGGPEAGPDLSDLDMGDDLPAEAGDSEVAETPSNKGAEDAGKESGGEESTGGGGGNGLAIAALVGKWTAYSLPVLALWWVVGAYLGQWVSAGWLILLVATAFVAGVPFGLYRAFKNKGRFRWWMAGVSLVLTVGLIAPLTGPASRVLTHFGHWPATAIAEVTGSAADSGEPEGLLVETVGSVGGWIGAQLNPELPAEESARRLGSPGPTASGE